jgi:hypothetical protein
MPVIPATQEAESGGSWFKASLAKQFKKPYIKRKKKKIIKKRDGGVAQGIGPEFKPQYPLPRKKIQIL